VINVHTQLEQLQYLRESINSVLLSIIFVFVGIHSLNYNG